MAVVPVPMAIGFDPKAKEAEPLPFRTIVFEESDIVWVWRGEYKSLAPERFEVMYPDFGFDTAL